MGKTPDADPSIKRYWARDGNPRGIAWQDGVGVVMAGWMRPGYDPECVEPSGCPVGAKQTVPPAGPQAIRSWLGAQLAELGCREVRFLAPAGPPAEFGHVAIPVHGLVALVLPQGEFTEFQSGIKAVGQHLR